LKKAPLIYDKAMHEARKYWRDRLESMSFEGRLALDHPRPKDGQPQISSLELGIDEEINAILQRLTAGNSFLLYTTLVLALKICLHKHGGERGITIFSPSTDGAIPNLLPIDGVLDGACSFKDTLLATKELLSNAYKNQQYPFSRMLLDIPDERRPKQLSMIASMVGFNEESSDSQCDVVVLFDTVAGKTRAVFRFDNRIYHESTIRYFFKSFSAILYQGLGKMATRIADLRPYADTARPAEVSPSPAETDISQFKSISIHGLIETQSAEHPENVAVVQDNRVTTYRELNQQADELAEVLASLRLDARKPVAVLMDAGTEMIVSMLAVMKACATFAPIKLLSIKGPIDEVLGALDCECVVCHREMVADLQQFRDSLTSVRHWITIEYSTQANGNGSPSLRIARDRSASRADADDSALPDAGSERAALETVGGVRDGENGKGDERSGTACVLVDNRDDNLSITSISHIEMLAVFQWLNIRCGINAQDRCLLSPSIGGCEQLYDTLGMLMAGAGVEIADASSLRESSLFAERLMAPRITVWDLPTPLAQNLLSSLLASNAEVENLQGPRNILLSGEKQSPSLAGKLTQRFPNARVTGLYANPAIGIWTTAFPFQSESVESDGVAVAEAIPGFEHRVLNKIGEPAPFHGKGELYVRRLLPETSAAISTGLKAAQFEGGRIKWLRGEDHRFIKYECSVELTILEAALCQHEDIRAAEVITIRSELDSDSLVVAFILSAVDQITPETARDFLVYRDGVDLIPDRFIVMDEFPLTASGAIDRDVLIGRFVTSREPKDEARSVEDEEIHKQLRGIWLEALQLDDVDDDESFFARGGNSLKATLLITRIRDEFGVDLSVQNFFRKPTTRAVAQLIAAEMKNADIRPKGPDFKAVSREKYRVQLSDVDS